MIEEHHFDSTHPNLESERHVILSKSKYLNNNPESDIKLFINHMEQLKMVYDGTIFVM